MKYVKCLSVFILCLRAKTLNYKVLQIINLWREEMYLFLLFVGELENGRYDDL